MKHNKNRPTSKITLNRKPNSMPPIPRVVIGILTFFFIGFLILPMIVAILATMLAVPIGYLIGKLRAKQKLLQSDLKVHSTNPYQYYKELLNDFGIGITTLLSNSAIENEKDVVAAILDLCAQGYLHLSRHSDHYVIQAMPHSVKTPLANEIYLLDLIQKDQLPNINYQEWYQKCVQDGVHLGLFQPFNFSSNSITRAQELLSNLRRTRQSQNKTSLILFFIFIPFLAITIISSYFLPTDLMTIIFATSFSIMVIAVVCSLVINISITAIKIFRHTSDDGYKTTLEKRLQRTDKGIAELQKLQAFKAFLTQFNTFVDKDPEAVILWDRYLSYAQVFGIADKLMGSGNDQLINNAAFQIDNINHISLANLEVNSL